MGISVPTLIFNGVTVETASGTAQGSTTVVAPPGSLVIVTVYCADVTDTVVSLTDSAGNTYSFAARSHTNASAEIWYISNSINNMPIGTSFTATTTLGAPQQCAVGWCGYSTGANGGLDKTAANNGTGVTTLTATTPTLTTRSQICFATEDQNIGFTTYTEDGNWTELNGSPVTNHLGVDVAYRIVNAKTAVSWAPSWTAAANIDMVIATFQETVQPPFAQWGDDAALMGYRTEIIGY